MPPNNCHQPIATHQLPPTNCHQLIATNQLPPTCHQAIVTNQLHRPIVTNQLSPTKLSSTNCHQPIASHHWLPTQPKPNNDPSSVTTHSANDPSTNKESHKDKSQRGKECLHFGFLAAAWKPFLFLAKKSSKSPLVQQPALNTSNGLKHIVVVPELQRAGFRPLHFVFPPARKILLVWCVRWSFDCEQIESGAKKKGFLESLGQTIYRPDGDSDTFRV